MNDEDPRVYFAAERTLLAWVRTGIAMIGLGFVTARFGLFMSLMRGAMVANDSKLSVALGACLSFLGAGSMAFAAWQHARFIKTLSQKELPRKYSIRASIGLSFLLALSGALLAAHLVASTAWNEK